MTSINRELLKGSLDVVLLHLLESEPMYGYQIVKEVRRRSQGLLELKEGSLYAALHRLEQSGLVEIFWQLELGPSQLQPQASCRPGWPSSRPPRTTAWLVEHLFQKV